MQTSRRGFLTGLGALIAAPAIVKSEILMPVKSIIPYQGGIIDECNFFPFRGRGFIIISSPNSPNNLLFQQYLNDRIGTITGISQVTDQSISGRTVASVVKDEIDRYDRSSRRLLDRNQSRQDNLHARWSYRMAHS